MESKGVIYLNQGIKCIQRLLISVYSLRKHYDGNITVFTIMEQPDWLLKMLKELKCDTVELEHKGIKSLVRKAQLWEDTPYDTTLFLDADTVVVDNIDEYFDKIKEYKFCTGEFAEWKTTGGTMRKRIKSFAPIVPDYVEPSIQYGKATNTGIFGFTKDAPILKEWKWIAEEGQKVNRIPDEVGCQMLLHKYKHWLAPVKWGVSVKMAQKHHTDNMKIIHYHGRKHVADWELCAVWKQTYWELLSEFPEYRKVLMSNMKDRRLNRYLKAVKKNVTIVTAVNPKYLNKLKSNYPHWLKTEGIMEYPMILFVNGIAPDDPYLSFLRKSTQIIPWDMEGADSMRELMLTAFVLGTAEHVKTDWWIKLDADTTPKYKENYRFGYKLEFSDKSWKNDAFSGHRCGYTKPGEFLVRLEDWADKLPEFKDHPRIFPDSERPAMLAQKRYGHRRVASYICLQSTKFTKLCAKLAGNKLPIPSHDSYMWYVAKRLGYPVIRHNFKRNFQP